MGLDEFQLVYVLLLIKSENSFYARNDSKEQKMRFRCNFWGGLEELRNRRQNLAEGFA